MGQRIVVTGIGILAPNGIGREEVWEHLLAGCSGVAPVTSFDPSSYSRTLGAEIKGFDPALYFERQDPASMARASQLAVAAARLAIRDADLDLEQIAPERVGLAMGTTSGEPREIERFDDRYVAGQLDAVGGELIEVYPCHLIACHLATEFGLAGVSTMISTACAAGNYAVANAFDALRAGRAEVMLAGGVDSFSRITYAGFARLAAIAPDHCQPFDRNRKGMIPGEGAAVLILETLDRARARGARIFAEVCGYGLSCDAHHMTASHPEGDGPARAMLEALKHSQISADEVSYISAHGTATPTNDKLETLAVYRVFGERAKQVPISSIKSMIGHTMGAASAIEAGVCALAIATDKIPPTINYEEPDPECDLDCVPNVARELPVHVVMNNAYAFGGNNASVIFKKCL